MPASNRVFGRWGEAAAAEYLRQRGYQIIASGYRCRFGEIDLIAKKKKLLVFCEVKTRRSAAFAPARAYVDGPKQQRLRQTAAIWLAENQLDVPCRFDVLEVYAPEGVETVRPEIIHLENAFT